MQEAAAEASKGQLDVVVHRRYNPEGISQYNIVPGLLGVILQMTLVMMTSIALTRETERGTMENLLAMPSSPFEIMLGKVLPYLVVGGVQVVVVLAASKLLFAIPFTGSMSLLLTAVLVFVLALVLLGYTISTIARTQMQALQLTFFFFLPSILLSGFMFPYRGMPQWAQTLGEILPLTHFLRVTRAVMLKGADWPAIGGEVAALSVFVVVFAGMAGKLTKLAAGVLMTHYTRSKVDLALLADITRAAGGPGDLAEQVGNANTARHAAELWDQAGLLPAAGRELCARAARVLSRFAAELTTTKTPLRVRVIMVDFTGQQQIAEAAA
jgi:ABC-type multidrug transport system permease subunit